MCGAPVPADGRRRRWVVDAWITLVCGGTVAALVWYWIPAWRRHDKLREWEGECRLEIANATGLWWSYMGSRSRLRQLDWDGQVARLPPLGLLDPCFVDPDASDGVYLDSIDILTWTDVVQLIVVVVVWCATLYYAVPASHGYRWFMRRTTCECRLRTATFAAGVIGTVVFLGLYLQTYRQNESAMRAAAGGPLDCTPSNMTCVNKGCCGCRPICLAEAIECTVTWHFDESERRVMDRYCERPQAPDDLDKEAIAIYAMDTRPCWVDDESGSVTRRSPLQEAEEAKMRLGCVGIFFVLSVFAMFASACGDCRLPF
jgi:hypothetical protein